MAVTIETRIAGKDCRIARFIGTLLAVLVVGAFYIFWLALAPYRSTPAGYLLHLAVVPAVVALALAWLAGARTLLLSGSIAWLFITAELVRRVGPGARPGDVTPYFFEFLAWLPYYVIVTGALLAGTIAGVTLRHVRQIN